jgi:hypothetical protein
VTRLGLAAVLASLLALPHAAGAHQLAQRGLGFAAAAPAACAGDPIAPTQTISGEFSTAQQGSYVLVPFEVPAGTTSVRVKYCFDQPEAPTSSQLKHTLDLGIYDARSGAGALFGEREFRGWGGSSHPDVTISPEGFSSQEQYEQSPKGHVPGKTTRGFVPGPLPAGEWAAELGVAAVVSQAEGDLDGKVAWRIEIELSSDPAHADEPYQPASYDESPANRQAGWYAGDLHVHSEHSALGDATMTETFDYAFKPPSQGGAGLDFITLSDYVTDSAWGEIGRYQPAYPGKLVARSSEIITYRGHTNNHVSGRYVDYRTGPVLEGRADGSLEERRGPRPPSELFPLVHGSAGWTQVNHPTIFPSETPGFANLCRGCPWDYSDEETQWEAVDAYEVATGPAGLRSGDEFAGANPFTLTAIEEFDRLRRERYPVTAVAVSDSHNAGRTPNPITQAPIGVGTTVVYANGLSEKGLREAVGAGHAYVKLLGSESPDLRFDAVGPGGSSAMMGDLLPAGQATFEARVMGGAPNVERELLVLRDRTVIETVPVRGEDFSHSFSATQPGEYRIQVQRGSTIDALSNPIGLGVERRPKPAGAPGAGPAITLRVKPRRARVGRRTRFVFRARSGTSRPRQPVRGARVRFAGKRRRTNRRGRAVIVKRFAKPGRRRARATKRGFSRGTAIVRVMRR